MHKRVIAAALVAPMLAFAPASAFAHHCGKGYRHHHHARGAEKGAYGSGESMNKNGGAQSQKQQDMNQSGGGATDRGAGGSTSSGGKI